MSNKVIDINNVCFHYQEQKNASLTHVNLQINEGEVVVLCGESGCGKSTIIRLINGLIPYYYKGRMDGQVKVLGHLTQEGNIYNMGSKVSSVFQNPRSQFFCVDVKSELAFGAENLNYDKDEIIKRIEDASHELKFEYLLDRTMFQLSGGEKQKIACASVSITDNPIVVLDEPSSNLDMHAVTELKAMIRYWKQKGKTVVIAEHRFRYLKGIADRFIYMKKGKIVCEFSSVEMQKLPAEELMSMGLRNLSYDNLEIQNYNEAKTFMRIHDFIFRYKGSKKLSLFIDEMDIPKASVIAIIGRNGAGKSTFVRSLCGLEKKAKGLLEDGNVMLKAKKRLNNSFLVMQDVNRQLFTESVEEEIILSMDEKNDNLVATLQIIYKKMFLESQNTYITKPLADLCSKIGSGATPKGGKAAYFDKGISLIRSMNVFDYFFSYPELAHISQIQANALANVEIQQADVLFNITGVSVTRCCVVPDDVLPARVNQHVMIIRPYKGKNMSYYIMCTLCTSENKAKLLGIGQSGSTREAINKQELERFEIPVPSDEELERFGEIATKIYALIFSNTNEIRMLCDMKDTLLTKLSSY